MTESDFKNQILNRFPLEAQKRFESESAPVHFDIGDRLEISNDQLFLIESGSVSLFGNVDADKSFEVLSMGNEGLLGVEYVFTNLEPEILYGTIEGKAWCLNKEKLKNLMQEFPEIKSLVTAYLGIYIEQLKRQATCVRKHAAGKRVVTAVLTAQQRCGDTFTMTQDAMSKRLSISRTHANAVAAKLAAEGAIRYTRGKIKIVDKCALEKLSCPCYQAFLADLKKLHETVVEDDYLIGV